LIGERTIFFRHDEVRSLEKAKLDLRKAVQQTERDGFRCTSPISRAEDIADLLDKSSASRDQLATILQEILNIKDSVDSVESEQSSLDSSISDVDSEVPK
jgi:chromosome segregation ATPase